LDRRASARARHHGQFTVLSERISGQDLGNFFQIWLYTPSKPTSW
jgi:hypothetical protein